MTPGVKLVRKQPPNIRRKKFIKNLTDGLGVGQSALRAGYASRTEGTALLREPSVLTALQTAMEKAGIDDKYLSSKIKDGLEATYPEKKSKDGGVLQAAGQADFFTRSIYVDKALKVRGDYSPERHIEEKRILTINVNMDMARGLRDCGAITVEEIKQLSGENDVGTDEGQREPVGFIREGGEASGDGQEDRQEPQGVRDEAEHA